MLKWVKTENIRLIDVLDSQTFGLIFVVPGLSYRHPNTKDYEAFITLLTHARNKGFHVAFEINDFIQESELHELDDLMIKLIKLQPEAIYFNDLAVGQYLIDHQSRITKVYAPETILTNGLDIAVYLEVFDRIVIAKELTLEELLSLAQQFPDRIEFFACGYPCMSISRRPLVQNYLDEIKSDVKALNHCDLRIFEERRHDAMPILEEARVTSIYQAHCFFPYQEYETLKKSFARLIHDDLFIEANDFVKLLNHLEQGCAAQIATISTSTSYLYRKTNLTKETQS